MTQETVSLAKGGARSHVTSEKDHDGPLEGRDGPRRIGGGGQYPPPLSLPVRSDTDVTLVAVVRWRQ